ncbi:MAG: transglycosylase SLT domain-containing protein [Acetobacteraceae bacterium]
MRRTVASFLGLTALAWPALMDLPSAAASPALASPADPSALCRDAVQQAEQRYKTPPGLLMAIARAESGRALASGEVQPWPWAANIGGTGAYFESREAAVLAVRQAIAASAGYIDTGCMQVNLQFHPKAFRSLEEAFDPVANADYAARFLVSLRDAAAGNWFIAVGMYHSRSPDLAQLYRQRVTMAGTAIRSAGSGKVRITLGNGKVMVINVNRQPARVRRHRSACDVAQILGHYLAASARARACPGRTAARVAATDAPRQAAATSHDTPSTSP